MGATYDFVSRPLGRFFRKILKNPAAPRVIIVMNTIYAPGGTHGSL